jgi:SAM-dependent methyltransferase
MKQPSASHPNRGGHNWLAYKLLDRELLRVSRLVKGEVLDAGCGACSYQGYVLQRASRYIGLDRIAAPGRLPPDVLADLGAGLPLPDRSFDTVLCLSVLEHTVRPGYVVTEFARVLRPGGCLVLQVPWQWHVHEAPNDYFRFTPYALRVLCREAGLEEFELVSMGGCFSMLALKCNYISLRLVRGPGPVKAAVRAMLWPAWAAAQLIAPVLDHLDRNPEAETGGYFVIARKRAS